MDTLFGEVTASSLAQPPNAKICRVSIIGPPNAGKSVLVNSLVGNKVSAVSPKRHTTREAVLGAYTKDNTQLVTSDGILCVCVGALSSVNV